MMQTVITKLNSTYELGTHEHLAIIHCTCMVDGVKYGRLQGAVKHYPWEEIRKN